MLERLHQNADWSSCLVAVASTQGVGIVRANIDQQSGRGDVLLRFSNEWVLAAYNQAYSNSLHNRARLQA